jgi:raffinose/stachyose/melibiose transport system permease protein
MSQFSKRQVLTPATGTAQRRRRPWWASGSVPWLFAIPGVLCILALRYLPSLVGGAAAFTDWDGMRSDINFVGWTNFERIFQNPITAGAIWHTLVLGFVFVLLVNVAGIALALALHRSLRTRNLLRAIFFLPFALSQLATAFIWQFIYAYDGPLNIVLGAVGLEHVRTAWLGDPAFALSSIVVVMVWQYSGLSMVIYLAGLEGISEEIHDAAAVDGAGTVRKFVNISLPLLAPAITISLTLTLIFGLGAFDQILGLTNGGPVNSTQTIATQVWLQTFVYSNFSQGTALAVVFTGIVTLLAVLQIVILRIREERTLS